MYHEWILETQSYEKNYNHPFSVNSLKFNDVLISSGIIYQLNSLASHDNDGNGNNNDQLARIFRQ